MINLIFNKKNTKYLIQASANTAPTTKTHLDWSLENKKSVFGCVKETFFKGNIVFVITKEDTHYRLICSQKKSLDFYCIEDINDFLRIININELNIVGDEKTKNEFKKRILEAIDQVYGFPYTGIVEVQGDKIFLYDYVGD